MSPNASYHLISLQTTQTIIVSQYFFCYKHPKLSSPPHLSSAVWYCGCRNEGPVCGKPRGQRFSLYNLEQVSVQPCMLRLLPGISSFVNSTFPVHSPVFFSKTSPSSSLCYLWLAQVPVSACRTKQVTLLVVTDD